MHRIIRWSDIVLRWGIILLVPLTPLIVAPSLLFPYVTGKGFFFSGLIEALLIPWATLCVTKALRRNPIRHPFFLPLTYLLTVVAIADLFGVNPARSVWSNFERMEGLVLYAHLYLLFMMAISVFRLRDWTYFFQNSIFVSALVALYAYGEKAVVISTLSGGRIFSTIGNAAYLASYIFLHLFLIVYLASRENNKKKRVIYGALFLFELPILFLTQTRGTYLGFIVSAVFILVSLTIYARTRIGKITAVLGLALMVAFPLALFLFQSHPLIKSSPLLNRFASMSLADQTVQARFHVWGIAWDGIRERPWLGWGQENFIIPFAKYYRPELFGNEPWFDRTHNTYLQWIIDAGSFGFLGFVWILGTAVRMLWRRRNYLFLAFGAGYAVQNLFIFDTLVTYGIIIVLLGYIGSQEIHSKGVHDAAATPPQSLSLWRIIPVLSITLIIVLMVVQWTVIRPLRVSQSIVVALRAAGRGNMHESGKIFDGIFLNNLYRGKTEAREQFVEVAAKISRLASEDQKKYIRVILEKVTAQLDLEIKRDPLNLRPLLALLRLQYIQLLNGFSSAEIVERTYARAYALAPQYMHTHFESQKAQTDD